MTYHEALSIPELMIYPTGMMEDCFYLILAEKGEMEEKDVQEIKARVEQKKKEDLSYYEGCRGVALLMYDNLKKYGHPCIEWWPKD